MRICLVHEEYPEETNFGGIATYQKTAAEELVKQGHIVYVIARGIYKNQRYKDNGVNIIRVNIKESNSYKQYILYRKKVASILEKMQKNNIIDIIETPDWGAETIFFEKKRNVPLVVRLHTPLKIWLKYNKNDFGKIKYKLLKWESKMIKSADYITCCSSALKKQIVKNFNISDKRIIVTPNPANLNSFYCDKKIVKENKLIYVGSLEQRKGVCILAKALNIVFKKYPDLKIEFVGKDTNRNSKNISTKDLICKIVYKEFNKNLIFSGQIPNYEINKHLNSSILAVFPALFDNFPYVVLEAMSCGLHIVGSKNSGMVEMLNDPSSIYKTGSAKDLAIKIEEKYKLALKNNYNLNNINRVKKLYSSKIICKNIILMYQSIILNYNEKNICLKDLQNVLNKLTKKKVISFFREKSGVANYVYKVKTKGDIYIIKKYNYHYDFDLANNLYDIYESNKICIIRPLNKKPILYKNNYFNIFPYIKKEKMKRIDINYLARLILVDRNIDKKDMLLEKCNFYFSNIKNKNIYDIPYHHIDYVLQEFKKIKKDVFCPCYLNHGDIQKDNIIKNNKKYYLIDFDETIVGPYLYDFAVIIVKFYSNTKINKYKLEKLKKIIQQYNKDLKDEYFYNIIKLYLCKILLEKYYYHSINKINLLSKYQKKDNYIRYLMLLKKLRE